MKTKFFLMTAGAVALLALAISCSSEEPELPEGPGQENNGDNGGSNNGDGNENGGNSGDNGNQTPSETLHLVKSVVSAGETDIEDDEGNTHKVFVESRFTMEYDAQNRISVFHYTGNDASGLNTGTATFRYGTGGNLTIHFDIANDDNMTDYVCTLNSDGYITAYEYSYTWSMGLGWGDANGNTGETEVEVAVTSQYAFTYQNGYLSSVTHTDTSTYVNDGSLFSKDSYRYDYTWTDGNLFAITGGWTDSEYMSSIEITYGDEVAAPMNFNVTALFDAIEKDPVLGMLGFFGKPSKNLPLSFGWTDEGDSEILSYTFHPDGTVATMKNGDMTMTFTYVN